MALKLTDGIKDKFYFVCGMSLPVKTAKRLEALGMISGTKIYMLNKKKSALVVVFRGTRFALGKAIAQNIEVDDIKSNNTAENKSGGYI
ncbi:MAG: ferrous iron transport protein A [Oscillospiraceae bacterium]|nr:ferrous iron transport protein A [Oscillospiraceae bacterium]